MAINEIEMNTNTLAKDIEDLEELLLSLEGQIEEMFQAVKELDGMWSGPAHDAFIEQFQWDYQSSKDMCHILRELIDSLRHAGEEYDKCEQNINSVIGSLRI